jgi:ADP-ribose pyrophosphatase YjhB (NUDIX family)
VTNDGRLLLVRRAQNPWRGFWDVPGGFCEPGEHPIETAAREVFEETGVSVDIVGFLGMWLDEYGDDAATTKSTLNIYYHAVPRTTGDPLGAPDPREVSEIAWFAPDALPSRNQLAFPQHTVSALDAWRVASRQGQLASPLLDQPSKPER